MMASSPHPDSTVLPGRIAVIVNDVFTRYEHLQSARDALIRSFHAIVQTFDSGGILYLCGNGGSFADAVHIKGELAKSFVLPRPMADAAVIERLKTNEVGRQLIDQLELGLPVVVLGESHSLRSAFGNDVDPHLIYAQELNAFAGRIKPGVLIGISTSGNAKNVIVAMTLAKAYRMATIAFTGPDGGTLAKIADIAWKTPGDSTHIIQENQLPFYHALCLMIESYYFG